MFVVPLTEKHVETEKVLTFEEIELSQVENTKAIKELVWHKTINGTLWSTTSILLLIALIVLFILKKKGQRIQIRFQNEQSNTEELIERKKRYPYKEEEV